MSNETLSIGIPTAGRPDAIRRCLKRINEVVEYPHDTIILDDTPDVNSQVSYQDATTVLYPDEQIGPGESRERITAVADSDLLLFLDDDTFPKRGSVTKLVEAIDEGYEMASGVWTADGSFEDNRALGRIFQWGFRDGQRILIDIPISPTPVRQRGFERLEVDVGLPTLLVRTDLLDSVSFDPRYEWFYEWIDFFLQTRERDERVCACLDSQFEHADIPYSTSTIRSEQERKRDRKKFLDKWGIELCRDAAIDSSSWKQSKAQSKSLDRAAAQAYAEGGISCVANRVKRKLRNVRHQ